MGQSSSKELDRLSELVSIVIDADRQVTTLKPLAAAEEAANIPPTPHSSQAAFYAACQRFALALDERRAIYLRLGEPWQAHPALPHACSQVAGRLVMACTMPASTGVARHPLYCYGNRPSSIGCFCMFTCPPRLPLLLQPSCAVETPTLLPCPHQRRHFRPKVRGVVCMEAKLELLSLPALLFLAFSPACLSALPSCLPACGRSLAGAQQYIGAAFDPLRSNRFCSRRDDPGSCCTALCRTQHTSCSGAQQCCGRPARHAQQWQQQGAHCTWRC